MQFRQPHPWDPKYALPENVLTEPPRFGTHTTKYLARRTIDAPALPSPWKPGYAYPSYLRAEPLGRGVFRTAYTPRKTVDTLVPSYLSGADLGMGADVVAELEPDPSINIRGGTAWLQAAQSRYDSPLGGGYVPPIQYESGEDWLQAAQRLYDLPSTQLLGLGADAPAPTAQTLRPITEFGQHAAEVILSSVRALPRPERVKTLKKVLDRLEPGLDARVQARMRTLQGRGMEPTAALRRSIAAETSHGLSRELVELSKGKRPARSSLMGCAMGLGQSGRSGGAATSGGTTVATRTGKRGPKTRTATIGPITGFIPSYVKRPDGKSEIRGFSPRVLTGTATPMIVPVGTSKVTGTLPAGVRSAMAKVAQALYVSYGGIKRPGGAQLAWSQVIQGKVAIARVQGPTDDLFFAVYIKKQGDNRWVVEVKKEKKRFFLVHWVLKGVEWIVDAVEEILDKVGDMVCGVVSSDAGKLAAGGAAVYMGAPPQAGVEGARIAEGLCQNGGPPPPPPPAAGLPLVPLLIGGGALAFLLLRRKKR